ncbi:MAG: AmmeMemoRadiSam system protein B [Planctomycetaceae bacterium]|nr:AmmeMemoRadiSam system protein B [Planctomycetaceae bacterium]
MSIRPAAVAGTFFSADPRKLRRQIEGWLGTPARPKARALGVMVPHAGYIYSGEVCARALASVEIPQSVLILHTKHQAGGAMLSLATFDAWETPLGEVNADAELAAALGRVEGIVASNAPHTREHAAEVVLPFLRLLREDLRIAVISVGPQDADTLQAVARTMAPTLAHTLLVASSDMNHYESHEVTLAKDNLALERLAAFDPEGLLNVCADHDISMCGAAATALMLFAARELGARRVELLEHTTSGPASGDFDQVVGYASARVM